MSERIKKFEDELELLIKESEMLYFAMQHEFNTIDFEKEYLKCLKNDKKKLDELIKRLPNFKNTYQQWYSKAQALIKQVLPNRLPDFVSYYGCSKARKEITYQNYMIRDCLQGLQITRGHYKEVIANASSAIPQFVQQANIVKAAKEALNSKLIDLTSVLQAELFDSEIDSAAMLVKKGHLRAAGAICGVVIEKHLRHVCEIHNISIKKKNPVISDLNQLLRDADIVSVASWRFIQHLADIRNICTHNKEKEPTKGEAEDLVSGTQKILKTIF